MSAKCLDQQGRWRNVTVAFRVSPEEDALIEKAVSLSGLTKQDYIIKKLTDQEVIVQGNPKVYKALKTQMVQVLAELQQLTAGTEPSPDTMKAIQLIAQVMDGMKNEPETTPKTKGANQHDQAR